MPDSASVLIVDDDPDVRGVIAEYLAGTPASCGPG